MPIRDFIPGERPSAADFDRYFMQQIHVVKPSDESRNTTTTLTADTHLFVPVLANTDYWVWCLIFYTGPSTNGDLKIKFTGPSGVSFDWISDAIGSAATSTISTVSRNAQSIAAGGTPSAGTITGSNGTCLVKGLLRVGSTAGNLTLTWAQLASSATDVTVFANSILIARRLTS